MDDTPEQLEAFKKAVKLWRQRRRRHRPAPPPPRKRTPRPEWRKIGDKIRALDSKIGQLYARLGEIQYACCHPRVKLADPGIVCPDCGYRWEGSRGDDF